MVELPDFRRYSFTTEQWNSYTDWNRMLSATQITGHSWLKILKAMRKQSFSLSIGSSLCMCATIINISFFQFDIYEQVCEIYKQNNYSLDAILTASLYFFGVCIGSIACGFNTHTWSTRWTNYTIASVLVISSALLFWQNTVSLCIARLLAGISYGFLYIVMMSQIADNVMKPVRGYMATQFTLHVTLGMFFGVGFSNSLWKSIPHTRWIFNTLLLLIPIISWPLTHYFSYESVTHLLKLDREDDARDVLDKSRGGLIDATVIQYEIEDRKLMLLEDYYEEQMHGYQGVLSKGNAVTLISMILLRLLSVFTSNIYLLVLSAVSIDSDLYFFMNLLLIFIRYMVLYIPMYFIDKISRKGMLLTSGLLSGTLFVPFAAGNLDYFHIQSYVHAAITFAIHVFAALGIEPVQHIYVSEAFPLSKRNASLAIVNCIEYVFQGIITIGFMSGHAVLLQIILLSSPFIVLFTTIALFVILPETKSMPLRRCRSSFNKNISPMSHPPRVSGVQTLGSLYGLNEL